MSLSRVDRENMKAKVLGKIADNWYQLVLLEKTAESK